jgi:hypothetical protein
MFCVYSMSLRLTYDQVGMLLYQQLVQLNDTMSQHLDVDRFAVRPSLLPIHAQTLTFMYRLAWTRLYTIQNPTGDSTSSSENEGANTAQAGESEEDDSSGEDDAPDADDESSTICMIF